MYNRNDKTFYNIIHVIIRTGIILQRLIFVGSKPTLECKQIFFKIFCSPDKFEWNT